MISRTAQITCCFLLAFCLVSCSSSPATSPRPKASLAPVQAAVFMPAEVGSFSRGDFEVHVEQLKKRLPSNDFTIVVQPPLL